MSQAILEKAYLITENVILKNPGASLEEIQKISLKKFFEFRKNQSVRLTILLRERTNRKEGRLISISNIKLDLPKGYSSVEALEKAEKKFRKDRMLA